MDRREDVLRQALAKNAIETERWQAFKTDQEVSIKNLDMFAQHLSVEVMVPIGKKALMPGELIHTNELLVGHYEGYFSTCSSYKAKEICTHRLRLAEEHLKQLEIEANLWHNKLEAPLLQGAMPNSEEIEIVEEYDEQSHNKWLAEHKESVRRQKQEERLQRQAEGSEDNVLQKLEESEMLEELGLNADDVSEEKLRELLGSEASTSIAKDEQELEMWKRLEAQEQQENEEINLEETVKSTDEMVRQLMSGEMEVGTAKQRIGKGEQQPPDEEDEDDELEEEEVKTIRAQMIQLPNEEREEFLKTQIQIIKAKMRKIQREHFFSEELTHLMSVVVALEDDLQEMIYEKEMEVISSEEEKEDVSEAKPTQKRRISFALNEEKLEFRQNETVAEMLPKAKKEAEQRSNVLNEKVERHLEQVREQQSVQNFDMVDQILNEMSGRIQTLHIEFQHSNAQPAAKAEGYFVEDMPGTPADFYELYEKAALKQTQSPFPIYVNGFEGESEVKVPILKETERETAYEDPRSEFSKPQSKSILRNKSAVESEPRVTNPQSTNSKKPSNPKKGKKKERTLDDDLLEMSAYQKVMHDVVEKEPEGKFIDTHTPKKRISRFKEQRAARKT